MKSSKTNKEKAIESRKIYVSKLTAWAKKRKENKKQFLDTMEKIKERKKLRSIEIEKCEITEIKENAISQKKDLWWDEMTSQ